MRYTNIKAQITDIIVGMFNVLASFDGDLFKEIVFFGMIQFII